MAKNTLRFIIFSFFSILTWFVFVTPVSAACDSVNDSAACLVAPLTYKCNYITTSGGSGSFCCDGADSCVAQKAQQAQSSSNGAVNSRPIFYPTGSCGEGAIDTALGCLPYTAEGFAPALLGFLAGIVGAIALIVMLFSTAQIMMAGGDAEAVKKGKELFTGAITGLLFIIFSVTLLKIIAGDVIQLPGF